MSNFFIPITKQSAGRQYACSHVQQKGLRDGELCPKRLSLQLCRNCNGRIFAACKPQPLANKTDTAGKAPVIQLSEQRLTRPEVQKTNAAVQLSHNSAKIGSRDLPIAAFRDLFMRRFMPHNTARAIFSRGISSNGGRRKTPHSQTSAARRRRLLILSVHRRQRKAAFAYFFEYVGKHTDIGKAVRQRAYMVLLHKRHRLVLGIT